MAGGLARSGIQKPLCLLTRGSFPRYIILLMGLFAMYTGLMYNDVVSLSFKFWKSGWDFKRVDSVAVGVPNGHVYPFGIDPAWHAADNGLVFTNSLKMKMSVILGVIHVRWHGVLCAWIPSASRLTELKQMSFAICLQVPNHLHFKHNYAVWAEFLPQFLFMESIFGESIRVSSSFLSGG
jgi:V-type H+-transporting ATPase subunit a